VIGEEQFDALCEANSFGAVARGEFPLVPRALLKALVDATAAAEREAVITQAIEQGFISESYAEQFRAAIRSRSQA
jgi:hypothetical protein